MKTKKRNKALNINELIESIKKKQKSVKKTKRAKQTKKSKNPKTQVYEVYRVHSRADRYIVDYSRPIYTAFAPYVGRRHKNTRKYMGVGGDSSNPSNKYNSVAYNSIAAGGDSRIAAMEYQQNLNVSQLAMNKMSGGDITIPQFSQSGPQQAYNSNTASLKNNQTIIYGKAQATGDRFAQESAPSQGIAL